MSKSFATDYIDVAARIAEFITRYPEGSLQAEIVELTPERVTMRAAAYRTPDDDRPGIGFAWEVIPGRTPYTKGSELMVCETSAWGRAIAALGIATKKGIATAEEVRAAQDRRADPEPVSADLFEEMGITERQRNHITTAVEGLMDHGQAASIEKLEEAYGPLDTWTAERAAKVLNLLRSRLDAVLVSEFAAEMKEAA